MSKPKAVGEWESKVREEGCIVTSQNDVQLHHVYGRKYKNMKTLIGPWYILPLCMRLHDVHSNDPYNVTHHPKLFARAFGSQKNLFLGMCQKFVDEGFELPFGQEVLTAITATRK